LSVEEPWWLRSARSVGRACWNSLDALGCRSLLHDFQRYPSSPFRFGPYANLARTVAADAHAWPYAMTTTVARPNMHITLSPSSFLFAHPQVHGQHALLWRPKAACLLLNKYHAAAPIDVRALQPSPSLTSAAPALTQRTAPVCCSRIPHEAALPSCSTAFVEGQRRTGLSAAA
jgi:hypothetical protein